MGDLRLIDLLNVEALQRIQDGFSAYTGMASIITDVNGVPVTQGSGFTRFCYELTRKSVMGCRNCEKCDIEGAHRTLKNGRATAYVCHAGLMDFAAPIMVEGTLLGGFIGGQVRVEDTKEDVIIQKAHEYGIDQEEYLKAFDETSLLTHESVEKAVRFVEELASGISLMAYKNYEELKKSEYAGRVAKSQADYVMNMSMNIENVMERWIEAVDRSVQGENNSDITSTISSMRKDGMEIRSSIKDIIGFIKISANDIEISESEYSLEQLKNMLTEALNNPESVTIVRADHEKLFGDVVRIWQIINHIIKVIYTNKSDSTPEILLSSRRIQYATYLEVTIIDRNTGCPEAEIERINSFFNKDDDAIYNNSDEIGVLMSLEGRMLKNMSGKVAFDRQGDDLVQRISIPQIGL